MKNVKIYLLLFCISGMAFAQLNDSKTIAQEATKSAEKDTIDGWKSGGTFTALANQSTFSNWLAGGENNFSGNAALNYNVNYKKGDFAWDTQFLLSYGVSKLKNQEIRKTDDQLIINSIASQKAWGNWRYSYFLNFKTQFSNGFDYDNDGTLDFETSGFMAPAYIQTGPGFLWKKHDNLYFNFAPATSKFTILSKEVYQWNKDLSLFESSKNLNLFGVDPGDKMRYELGLFASGYYKFNIMKNISLENILALYSNYLEDPQNVDIDYTANLVMQINKYITANFTFQTIYDDNAFRGFQTRQVFGVGFNYNF